MKNQLFAICCIVSIALFPCMNYKYVHVVKKDGSVADAKGLVFVPVGNELLKNKPFYEQMLKDQKLEINSSSEISKINDYGVTLVYLGRYQEAKKVFRNIEKKAPGYYSTAANLGTIYELLGKNDSAYLWIKKGISINPASHDSSEWIHLSILKFKKNTSDTVLTSNKLIFTDFGTDSLPSSTLPIAKLNSIKKQLYYQLCERMTFVQPKDRIVAQLLFDLANIVSITDDLTSALEIYKLAHKYGFDNQVFRTRVEKMQNIQNKALSKKKFK